MEDLKPSSREEAVLAKIAGIEDPMVDAFEPSSREEWFMNKIAEKMAEGGGGSGGGVFVVGFSSNGILNKTAREIMDAMLQKSVGLYVNNPSVTAFTTLTKFMYRNGSYAFTFGKDSGGFRCSSENDYPTADN